MTRKPNLSDTRTPSDAHVWKVAYQTGAPLYACVEHCERCGAYFHTRADAHGPVWCMPSAAWMAAHPDDDGAWRRDGYVSPMAPRARVA